MIKNCPVCEGGEVLTFISRKNVPVHQNMLFESPESAIVMSRGDLELKVCRQCSFIFNAAFDEKKLSYNQQYDNSQNYSSVFHQYTEKLCHYVLQQCGNGHNTVVEVGCGKAGFLKQLFRINHQITGYGFDPSYVGPDIDCGGRLQFIRDFYDEQYENIKADIVICRHVIEHISDPVSLLRSVRRALRNSPSARVYFETPSVEWILENLVVWDFFYEHCSYFSEMSITKAFQLANFNIADIKKVFGGQYLWIEAVPSNLHAAHRILARKFDAVEAAKFYARQESKLLSDWNRKLEECSLKGNTAIWGVGAKGVTFLNLFDKEKKKIRCAIDLNPNKQGKFVPGTGHSIIGYDEILEREIENIIVLNPNYKTEIQNILNENNMSVNLADLR